MSGSTRTPSNDSSRSAYLPDTFRHLDFRSQVCETPLARTCKKFRNRCFNYPRSTDVWTPLDMSPRNLGPRGSHSYLAIGRLKSGVTIDQAQADLAVIARRIVCGHERRRDHRQVRQPPD